MPASPQPHAQVGTTFELRYAVANGDGLVAQAHRTISVASPCPASQHFCNAACVNVTCSQLAALQAQIPPQASGPVISSPGLFQTAPNGFSSSSPQVTNPGRRRRLLSTSEVESQSGESEFGQVFLAYGVAAVSAGSSHGQLAGASACGTLGGV